MKALTSRERRVGLELPLEVIGSDGRGESFVEMTRSLNVSGGGLLFKTERALVVGSALRIVIHVPPTLRRHFQGKAVYKVRAVVCRVERFQDDAVSKVGVRFLAES
jgi:hypothetical protein